VESEEKINGFLSSLEELLTGVLVTLHTVKTIDFSGRAPA
jgi:PII-like signaling protein